MRALPIIGNISERKCKKKYFSATEIGIFLGLANYLSLLCNVVLQFFQVQTKKK